MTAAAHSESTLNLYGIIDTGLAYQVISGSDKINSSHFGLASGIQTTSRWGMRGSEDLGNGYSVNFSLENSFETNNGMMLSGGREFGLQSWLGLAHQDLGYFRMGRQSSYAPEYFLQIDPFRGGMGQARMAFAFGSANSNTKYSNLVKLMAQPLPGLKVGVGYSFAPQMTTYYYDGTKAINATAADYNFSSMDNTRLITLGTTYSHGPLILAASYDQVMPNLNAGVPNQVANPGNITEWIFGGKYDFDVVQVSFAIGQNRGGVINMQYVSVTSAGKGPIEASSWGGGPGAMVFDPGMSFNSYMLGFTLPINGASKIFGAWTQAAATGISNAQSGVTSQNAYSIGYQYDLSAKTDIYAATSYATNAGFVSNANSFFVVTGLRHRF
jgi:predicted porin